MPIRTSLRLPDFGAAGPASSRRRAGRLIGGRPVRRLGGAARDGLFRKMSTKRFGESRGSVARELALGRIRLGTNNARGLVSRCGHHGLLVANVAMPAQPKTGLAASPALKLTLTERFGQDISSSRQL